MEPTNLEQSVCRPTIRYSINELLEHRSSLRYVICPIDEFTLVAWAEGLLDKIGEYIPEELAFRKQYAKEVADLEETTAKHKFEYVGLTFADFLNLGKYGTPPKSQVGSSHSQKAQEIGTSTIDPIEEKNTHSQSTSSKETEKSDTGREIVEFNPDGGVQASSHAEVAEPTPLQAVEEPEESGDIVDQDAWINAMLQRTKLFEGNKYKKT
ncbi:hypothetical protein B9Z19DRAFT_1101263 [Tuber borchii]|uniref:Uncharacterized protein n=1 Tax=Tuber borchii TaxID=42251 RepID=A0A2T6ZT15_TUBBO|nr:hypothetical protein B9Z19DRAFT_1101263 [Tuber borchii]